MEEDIERERERSTITTRGDNVQGQGSEQRKFVLLHAAHRTSPPSAERGRSKCEQAGMSGSVASEGS